MANNTPIDWNPFAAAFKTVVNLRSNSVLNVSFYNDLDIFVYTH